MFFSLIKVVVVLGLILFMIYFTVKFLNKRNKLLQKVKTMENLGGISVGANKSVQIVRIGQQLYMLGVGDNVELLKEITDPETKESVLQQQESDTSFTAAAGQMITKQRKTSETATEAYKFKDKFTEELNKLQENRRQILQQFKKDDYNE
jgi:flagellar protein FliO/FliZ